MAARACLTPRLAPPLPLPRVVEAFVSVRRLAEFLGSAETGGPCRSLGGSRPPSLLAPGASEAIRLEGSFGWGGSSSSSTGSGATDTSTAASEPAQPGLALRDVQLSVPCGALVALTGPVGSGKSSLLAAVLGEMLPWSEQRGPKQAGHRTVPRTSGCVAAGSSVAYVPQDPWIMHGTLRCVPARTASLPQRCMHSVRVQLGVAQRTARGQHMGTAAPPPLQGQRAAWGAL